MRRRIGKGLAALALSAMVVACGQRETAPESNPTLKSLVADGVAAPRLTGGYLPAQGAPARPDIMEPAVMRARGALFDDETDRTSATLAKRAHWRILADGRETDMGLAVDALAALAAREPDNADRHNDLGAARWFLAETRGDVRGKFAALASVDRALALQPEMNEARFNRAFMMESLWMRTAAKRAWREYLAMAGEDLGWRAVGRERLTRFENLGRPEPWEARLAKALTAARAGEQAKLEALLAAYLPDARRELDGPFFVEWANAIACGDEADADGWLTICHRFALALESLASEKFYIDVTIHLRTLSGEGREMAAAGFLAYCLGNEAYEAPNLEWAVLQHQRAINAFGEIGNPFMWRAFFGFARAEEWRFNDKIASAAHQTTGELAYERGYLNLASECLWVEALSQGGMGRSDFAIHLMREGLSIARGQGDLENEAGFLFNLVGYHRRFGQKDKAWRLRMAALKHYDRIGKPLRRFQVYNRTPWDAAEDGWPRAGFYYFDDAVEAHQVLETRKSYAYIIPMDVRRNHANLLIQLGEIKAAEKAAALAEQAWSRIADPDERQRHKAFLCEIKADIAMRTDPGRAADLYRQALLEREKKDDIYLLASVQLAQGRAYLAAGDEQNAERSLDRCLETLEREWRRTLAADQRIGFFQRSQEAFDEMIQLQLRLGRPAAALRYAEQSRARALLEKLSQERISTALDGASLAASNLEEVWRLLPESTAMIAFKFVKNQLHAWILRSSGRIEWFPLAQDRQEIGRLALLFRESVESGAALSDIRALGSDLEQRLTRPLRPLLADADHWVIAPDGPLHNVPFAALTNEAGDVLIETAAIASVPSVGIFAETLARNRFLDEALPARNALFFGDPAFEPRVAAGLARLPNASREVERAAARLGAGETTLVFGEDATVERFLEAGEYELVHFAGHAFFDAEDPDESFLLLAPSEAGSGRLTAGDLYGFEFERTRLAVLSSCESAKGTGLRDGGGFSLARPFLAAGVPAVVAGFWRVEDSAARDLMEAFHQRLAEGAPAHQALRGAQLEMLARGGEWAKPRAWAAFGLIGGAHPLSFTVGGK